MEDEERRQLAGNPDWMSNLPEELLDVPLWNLAIPGKTTGQLGLFFYFYFTCLCVHYMATCIWTGVLSSHHREPWQHVFLPGCLLSCPEVWVLLPQRGRQAVSLLDSTLCQPLGHHTGTGPHCPLEGGLNPELTGLSSGGAFRCWSSTCKVKDFHIYITVCVQSHWQAVGRHYSVYIYI